MKAILKKYGFALFFMVAVIHLAAILFNAEDARFFTKLLLMPILALAVYGNSMKGKGRSLLLTAIFFSFAGDGFLLFDHINPVFFIAGLACFLLTHVLYIVYFVGIRPISRSPFKDHSWILLLIMAYGAGLVYLLYPSLGELKIPVIIYAAVICSMLIAGVHIFKRVNRKAGWLFITGALLFVVSDSLLAINKFSAPFDYAAFLIMFTYITAQYCIAKGFVSAGQVT